jgi:hypothetical protein
VLRALAARATRTIAAGGRRVAGGARASSARPIGAGRFRDAIGPGEERWYRVELDPGQRLAAAATLVTPCPLDMGVADAIGTSLTLSVFDGVDAGVPDAHDATPNLFATDTSVESVGLLTPAVAASSGVPAGRSSRWLRVVLDASPDSGLAGALGAQRLAMQLDVNVVGRARAEPADDDAGSGFGVGVLVAVVLGGVLAGVLVGAAARARRSGAGS